MTEKYSHTGSFIQNVTIAAEETHTVSVQAGQTLKVQNPDKGLRLAYDPLNLADNMPYFFIPQSSTAFGFEIFVTDTAIIYFRHDAAGAGNVHLWVVG